MTTTPTTRDQIEKELVGAIASAWCSEENAHKEMDADLAAAIEIEVKKFISTHFIPRERVVEEVKKLKRTDDTQMSDDHVYDDALEDVARALLEDRNKE